MKAVFKKDSRADKKNCRTISISPNVSKMYERCLYKQLNEYFQALLSKNQWDFQKSYSVIKRFTPNDRKMEKISRRMWCGAFGARLTDFS